MEAPRYRVYCHPTWRRFGREGVGQSRRWRTCFRSDRAERSRDVNGSRWPADPWSFFPDPKRIDGKVALTMGPASVWQPLLPDIGYDTASADIPPSGNLPVPDIQLDALAEN